MTVSFTIPGEPVPKGRPRRGSNGNMYTPAATRDAEDAIRLIARSKGVRPTDEYVEVRLTYVVSDMGKDLDNLVKLTLDALNGEGWRDDRQVHVLHAEKLDARWNGAPCTAVDIKLVGA